jgi:hypothetical protein
LRENSGETPLPLFAMHFQSYAFGLNAAGESACGRFSLFGDIPAAEAR